MFGIEQEVCWNHNMDSSLSTDKILLDSVKLINTTIEPVSILSEGSGYSLITSKSYNVNDQPHKILLEHIDKLVREETIGQLRANYDEFPIQTVDEALYNANKLDYSFDAHWNNITYDMSNLEFNLNPCRSASYGGVILETIQKFSNIEYTHKLIKCLHEALDKQCENGSNCAFRQYFFPELDVVGPVAYSIGIEELLTTVPITICSEAFYQTWVDTLNNALCLDNSVPQPKYSEINKCICCLVVQQSKTSLEALTGTSILCGQKGDKPLKHVRLLSVNGTEHEFQDLFSDFVHVSNYFSKHIDRYPFLDWMILKLANGQYEVMKKWN